MLRNKHLNEYLKLLMKVFLVLMVLSFLYIIYLCILDGSNHQSTMKRPVVVNTWNFVEGNRKAWSILENRGTALDAVEKGCAKCEELQCDLTVGYGGSPDESGETTLDAMIFDGTTMNVGAVGALRRVKNAISVARHVLDYTEHSLLVGELATSFAVKMGFREESLSTNTSEDIWKEWEAKNCQPNFWKNVTPDPKTSCGPYKPAELKPNVSKSIVFDRYNHDTIGMVALDSYGNIASGTSSNGARHKIPGRVGDSPIPGAGAYAEKDVGGAAATGDGDVMMRFLPSFKAVEELKRSSTPGKAAENALRNIARYYEKFSGAIVVMAANGEVGAACAGMKSFPYVVSFSDNVAITYHVNCINN